MRVDEITEVERQPRRLRFKVDDYYKMIELGMLENYEKSEIINGELVQKMTIGDRHAAVVNFLTRMLSREMPDTVLVSVQNPLRISEFDEPEPDFVLTDLTKYDGLRHPRPAETLIVIEVADTSLRYDRETKLPMYAEANIAEVWIVNLPNNVIEVHQQPTLGIYQLTRIFKHGETVESSILPDLKLEVDAILK
jgi:Uma2 family endonuclease